MSFVVVFHIMRLFSCWLGHIFVKIKWLRILSVIYLIVNSSYGVSCRDCLVVFCGVPVFCNSVFLHWVLPLPILCPRFVEPIVQILLYNLSSWRKWEKCELDERAYWVYKASKKTLYKFEKFLSPKHLNGVYIYLHIYTDTSHVCATHIRYIRFP